MSSPKLTMIKVHYYDDRSPDVVPVGLYETVLAERKFGTFATQTVEGSSYAVFEGAKRAGIVTADVEFEDWLRGVVDTETVDQSGESQAASGT